MDAFVVNSAVLARFNFCGTWQKIAQNRQRFHTVNRYMPLNKILDRK